MILFAAIEINKDARDLCETLQKSLKTQTEGSFPRRENLHVTLAYFGEVTEGAFEQIKATLDSFPAPRSSLLLSRLTAFEGRKGDHVVLLVNVDEGFKQYRTDLVEKFRQQGIAFDPQPFRPHVTLVRAKKKNIWLDGIRFTPVVSNVDRIVLYKSFEQRGIRIYEPVYVKEAKGDDDGYKSNSV